MCRNDGRGVYSCLSKNDGIYHSGTDCDVSLFGGTFLPINNLSIDTVHFCTTVICTCVGPRAPYNSLNSQISFSTFGADILVFSSPGPSVSSL